MYGFWARYTRMCHNQTYPVAFACRDSDYCFGMFHLFLICCLGSTKSAAADGNAQVPGSYAPANGYNLNNPAPKNGYSLNNPYPKGFDYAELDRIPCGRARCCSGAELVKGCLCFSCAADPSCC